MPKLLRSAAGVLIAWLLALLVPECVSALDLEPKVVASDSLGDKGAQEVTVAGNYAYVVIYESGFRIIEISDPAKPQQMGVYAAAGYAVEVTVSGSYAYLATQRRFLTGTNTIGGGLEIVDISDPANPQRVGSYSGGDAAAVAVAGNHACVAEGGGLRVVDVSDPTNPELVGSAAINASAVAISGNYAYAAQLNQGLYIVDISDPANPEFIGSYTTNGYFVDVAMSGGCVYLADTTAGLRIVDVSQPADPLFAARYGCSPYNLTISGSHLYVAAQPRTVGTSNFLGGLHIVDVSNPGNPQLAGRYDAINAVSVAVWGHHAYVLDGRALAALDVGNPANPTLVGGYAVQRDARDVVFSGAYAYVADGVAGLEVYDVSDATNPRRVGEYFIGTPANSVAVAGNQVCLLATGGMHVFDVADPANPRPLGDYSVAGDGRRVRIQGDFAYIVAKGTNAIGGGLDVVDITNPADPQRLGRCSSSNAVDVDLAGDYAYLTVAPVGRGSFIETPGSLDVINISNPANPQRVGRYVTAEQTQGVAVSGAYAYVADGMAGLHVIDISSPANPVRRAIFPGTSYFEGMVVIGGPITSAFTSVTVSSNLCFVGEMFLQLGHGIWALGSSVQVVDASDATKPKRVGSVRVGEHEINRPYEPGNHAQGMAGRGNHLLVAGGNAGLQMVDFSTPAVSQIAGHYDSSVNENGVSVAGDYGYVATQRRWTGSNWIGGGLQVIDGRNPAQPQLVGVSDPDDLSAVAVSGTNACVLANTTGLGVMDISDPSKPKNVGRYEAGTALVGLALQGNYGYVAGRPSQGRGGLHVVDISDPSNPRLAGRYDGGGEAFGVAVFGIYAYLVQGPRWNGSNIVSGGLHISDISNPMNPRRAGVYDTTGSAHDVTVSGNYAYLVGEGIGLHVLDISNPAQPQRFGAIDSNELGTTETVAVSGGYAYVMDAEGRLQVVDVRDATRPRRIGANTSFTAFFGDVPSSMAMAHGKLFLTSGNKGLFILYPYQPILFQQVSRLENGIRLQISGPPGVPGRVERSADLRSWTDWRAVSFAEEPISVIDSDTNSGWPSARTFYRIAVP
jgi:hypothetical protein